MAQNTLAVFGMPGDELHYEFRVTGQLGPAPVHGATDPDTGQRSPYTGSDEIGAHSAKGRDSGEGDGYWFTGDVSTFSVKRGTVNKIVHNGREYNSVSQFRSGTGAGTGSIREELFGIGDGDDSDGSNGGGSSEYRLSIGPDTGNEFALYRFVVAGDVENTEAPAGMDYVTHVGDWTVVAGATRTSGDEFILYGPVAEFEVRDGSPALYLDGSSVSASELVSQTGGSDLTVPDNVSGDGEDGSGFFDWSGLSFDMPDLSGYTDEMSTWHWAGVGLLGGAFALSLRDGEVLGQPEETSDEDGETDESEA